MIRKLTIENGRLIQKPLKGMNKLRSDLIFQAKNGAIVKDDMHGVMCPACTIELKNPSLESFHLNLFSGNGKPGFQIEYEKYQKKFTISR